MADTTSNMKLVRWNSLDDPYDSGQLAANWKFVDEHDHTNNKGVRIPNGGLVSTTGSEAVQTNVIKDGAVTFAKLNSTSGSEAVQTSVIKNSAVTTAKINDLAITTDKISSGAVTTDKILNNTIVNGDISESASIDVSKLASDYVQIGSTTITLGQAVASLSANVTGTLTGNVNATTGTTNLNNLTVTNAISGSVTGSAGSVAASSITGTTLASSVSESSLTKLGTQAQALNMGGFNVTNIPTTPSGNNAAASKAYVDQQAVGLAKKTAVQAATTANITSFPPTGTQTIDGISVTATSGPGGTPARVLVKNQTDKSQNGIWIVGTPWTRAEDMASNWSDVINAYVLVLAGNTNAATSWTADAAPGSTGTIGTTAINFTQFSASITITAGDGISVDGQTVSLKSGTGGVAGSGLTNTSGVLSINADQSSTITTLGNISFGAISGTSVAVSTPIAISSGGTGVGSSGTTANRVFASNGTGSAPSFRQIVAGDIASSVTLNSLGAPTSSLSMGSQNLTNVGTINGATLPTSGTIATTDGTYINSQSITIGSNANTLTAPNTYSLGATTNGGITFSGGSNYNGGTSGVTIGVLAASSGGLSVASGGISITRDTTAANNGTATTESGLQLSSTGLSVKLKTNGGLKASTDTNNGLMTGSLAEIASHAASTGPITASSQRITNVLSDASGSSTDAINKSYADTLYASIRKTEANIKTTLPTSGVVVGDEIYYRPSSWTYGSGNSGVTAYSGIIPTWHLRCTSTSVNIEWEFVGGSPYTLYSSGSITSVTSNNTTYPLNGIYVSGFKGYITVSFNVTGRYASTPSAGGSTYGFVTNLSLGGGASTNSFSAGTHALLGNETVNYTTTGKTSYVPNLIDASSTNYGISIMRTTSTGGINVVDQTLNITPNILYSS